MMIYYGGLVALIAAGGCTYVSSSAILDWRTWRWYSMLLTSLPKTCWSTMEALASLSARTLDDMVLCVVVWIDWG